MYNRYAIILFIIIIGIQCVYSFDCCVPNEWSGSSITNNEKSGIVTKKNYYYDEINLRIRIDMVTSDGIFNQTTFTSFTNLTSTGSEWLLDYNEKTCIQSGPDFWNNQCFGDSYGLPFIKQSSVDGTYLFSNPTNGITITTSDNTCIPIKFSNNLSQTTTQFYNTKNYISDDSIFNYPSFCK